MRRFPAMPSQFLLDAPSLVYRAFFSYPKTVTDPRGNPINAVRGFMEMVTRLITDRRPERLVAVFDAEWRPQWRVDLYEGYKSERPEDPPELPPQFEVLAQVLDAAGIARAEGAGLEADDVLATLVEPLSEDDRAVIVTGDRDLLALVRDPQVKVLFPVKGTKEMKEFDDAAVLSAYGVPARLYPEFAMLRGDPSDGLPGVAGIGPKRAADLLTRFGSIEGIYAGIAELPVKQRDVFEQARPYLDAVAKVVGLVTDADYSITEGHPPDDDALKALAERHNLGSSATRLAQALRSER